ncbi:S8 family serine peptidase [Sphingomonas cavernae]|uniref:Serine protease n=1 Tax=Sphingomonas cavernae TaxID=2320861 RepID=A0A418W5P7_9SPHN|nr:S8 family serine peptidase [Sphingomonas cavernae]RJF85371.1 serine protease [Sphingomonas cavernae]
MTRISPTILALALAALPVAVAAQVALPELPAPGGVIDRVTDALPVEPGASLRPVEAARQLVAERLDRLEALVRDNRDALEFDEAKNPAVRGVVIVTGADAAAIARAEQAGFALLGRETIEGLDLGYARLRTPEGQSLPGAIKRLRRLLPDAEVSADHLYFASGAPGGTAGAALAQSGNVGGPAMGLIDGGVARHATLTGAIEQRGFAKGAPTPSAHGTAVASLMAGNGAIRGAAPGKPLLVADIYGADPAGGSATAIARALGWMVGRGTSVVTMSLVGPANPLLARAVGAAQNKGLVIVAAVGNDGPAAPPAYPASYAGVIAVTGVDAKNRALVEAGRSLHLDYAAPGADMRAASTNGSAKVRGTSYAAPFVAGRLFAHYPTINPAMRPLALQRLTQEARDLGRKGPDKTYGYGLICGDCANR